MQQIKLSGLTCSACQKLIQKRIARIPGVEVVNVELDGLTEINAERVITNEEIINVLDGTNFRIQK